MVHLDIHALAYFVELGGLSPVKHEDIRNVFKSKCLPEPCNDDLKNFTVLCKNIKTDIVNKAPKIFLQLLNIFQPTYV